MSPLVNKDFTNPALSFDEEELETMINSFKNNITTTDQNEYDLDDIHGKVHWVDYPYIGLGEKPHNPNKYATDEDLERIIGG